MNSKKFLPWFRAYTEMVDDEKLRLLAFEDRWHFIALLCLKGQGLLDDAGPLLLRKVAVKLGLDTRTLEEVARRLAEVDLIDQDTLQPLAWDKRQMKSDSSAERVKAFRERKKQVNKSDEKAPKTGGNGYCNVTVTAQDTDTDTDINKPQQPARARAAAVPAGGGGALDQNLIQAAEALGLSEEALKANAQNANDDQLQILLELYKSPPPELRNSAAWAATLARRANDGALTAATPAPAAPPVQVQVWRPEEQPPVTPEIKAAALERLAKLSEQMRIKPPKQPPRAFKRHAQG